MQQAWKEYHEQHKDRFLEEMMELLRIPSVSAKSEHKEDMQSCADLIRQRLLDSVIDAEPVAVARSDDAPERVDLRIGGVEGDGVGGH